TGRATTSCRKGNRSSSPSLSPASAAATSQTRFEAPFLSHASTTPCSAVSSDRPVRTSAAPLPSSAVWTPAKERTTTAPACVPASTDRGSPQMFTCAMICPQREAARLAQSQRAARSIVVQPGELLWLLQHAVGARGAERGRVETPAHAGGAHARGARRRDVGRRVADEPGLFRRGPELRQQRAQPRGVGLARRHVARAPDAREARGDAEPVQDRAAQVARLVGEYGERTAGGRKLRQRLQDAGIESRRVEQ